MKFFRTAFLKNISGRLLLKLGILQEQSLADIIQNRCFVIFKGKRLCLTLFSIKLQSSALTPTQVFPCEYCKIFENSFFHITPLVATRRFSIKTSIFVVSKINGVFRTLPRFYDAAFCENNQRLNPFMTEVPII